MATKKETMMGAIMVFCFYCSYIFLIFDQILDFSKSSFNNQFLVMNWYGSAYSGFEKKVVESIKEELKSTNYPKLRNNGTNSPSYRGKKRQKN